MPARKNRIGKHGAPQTWQQVAGISVDNQVRALHPEMVPEVRVIRTRLIQALIKKENDSPQGLHFVGSGYEEEVFRMVNVTHQLRTALVNGAPGYKYVYVTDRFRVDYMGMDPDRL